MTAPAERPLFISQDKLVQWESEGKVQLQGTMLTLIAERRTYSLTEAVRFLKAMDPEPPGQTLVGKVRTKEQLKGMNAEHYMGSVILGDRGYEVQEGFVGMVALNPQEVPASFAVAPVTSLGPIAVPPAPAALVAPAVAPARVLPTSVPAAMPPVVVTPPPSPVAAAPAPAREPAPPPPAAAVPVPSQDLPSVAATKPAERSDAELLADFLLTNLNG